MSDTTSSLDDLFARLIEGLEADPRYDIEGFLKSHAVHAERLRSRLEKLRRAGFLGGAGPGPGSVLHVMRERFGISGTSGADRPAAVAAESRDELLPSRVVGGRYRILAEIGRGGMGRVFRALDVDLGREVALKVVDLEPAFGADTPQRRAYLERFLIEAQLTAQLEHPSIVPLHDIGIDRTGQLYYTMKLVEGQTLEALIDAWHAEMAEGGPLPTSEILRVVLLICDALSLAHDRGVIHRDLKPSNVMIGRFGEVHVMDWGVAKLTRDVEPFGVSESSPPRSATAAGEVVGTPSYMAPEQAAGDPRSIGPRSDVYGVGAILLHAVTGEVPRLRVRPTGIPVELRAICERAMQRDSARRYASASDMAADLQAFLQARPVSSHRDGLYRWLTKAVRRRPAAATGLGSALLLVVVSTLSFALYRELEQRLRVMGLGPALEALDDVESSKDKSKQLREYARAGLGVADLLADHGVDLAGPVEVEQLARAVDAADPSMRNDLVGGLYQLVRNIFLAGLAEAAQARDHGGAPPSRAEDLRLMAEKYPRLVQIWPRALSLLDHLQDQATGALAAHAMEDWLAGRPMDPLPGDWLSMANSNELDFVTFVLRIAEGSEKARPAVEAGLERDPGNFWLHARLSQIALEAGDDEQGLLHVSTAVALRPKSKSQRVNLAYALRSRNDYASAIRILRSVLEDEPDHYEALFNLAEALMSASPGSVDEPIALLERARKIEARDPDLYSLLGLAFDRKSAFDPSAIPATIEAYQRWTELSPDSWNASFQLARAYQLVDHDQALQHLDRALELSPGNEEVLVARIDSLWELGERDEALETCVQALEAGQAPEILQFYEELVPQITDPEQRSLHEDRVAGFRAPR